MAKTKYFRIACEGATVDGRTIERQWIEQMAAGYNPATYTARINCEHIAGFSPDRPFNAYGSVLALKAEEIQLTLNGKAEKRLALFAEIDANDQLIAINKADQKLFTSCEIRPDFAGTGKAYLVGLAVTDSPASLGTEPLKFAAMARPNLFTPAQETAIELVEPVAADDPATGAFAAMKAFFDRFTAAPPAVPVTPLAAPGALAPANTPKPPAEPANDNVGFAALSEGLGLMAASITALGTKIDTDTGALRTDLTALQTKLAATETPGFTRAPAHGGSGSAFVTDC